MFKLNYPKFWNKFGVISFILYPFSYIYSLAGYIRKLFSSYHKFDCPLICIGNFTVGGTGKTIMVKNIALEYLKRKKRVVVISKGYGGNYVKTSIIDPNFPTTLAGDEALEIAKELYSKGDVEVIIAKSPLYAKKEIEQLEPDLIICDDGAQNPNFHKDLKIMMVDGIRGFGNKFLIPAGPLRQKIKSEDNDVIVSINACDDVKSDIRKTFPITPEFMNATISHDFTQDDKIFGFCAIGNPDKFFNSIKDLGKICGHIEFPDHHKYTSQDLDKIFNESEKHSANIIVTTEKDYVKISEFALSEKIVPLRLELDIKDMKNLMNRIDAKLKI